MLEHLCQVEKSLSGARRTVSWAGDKQEELMDIPCSGRPGYFIGLENFCDTFLSSKYKFNYQHPRFKKRQMTWTLSSKYGRVQMGGKRRACATSMTGRRQICMCVSVYVQLCVSVCVAVKNACCPDPGVCVCVYVHYEGHINTIGLI